MPLILGIEVGGVQHLDFTGFSYFDEAVVLITFVIKVCPGPDIDKYSGHSEPEEPKFAVGLNAASCLKSIFRVIIKDCLHLELKFHCLRLSMRLSEIAN